MADSADTTAERTRCRTIIAAIMGNPTPANFKAAQRAISRGTAAEDFTPPDAAATGTGGAA